MARTPGNDLRLGQMVGSNEFLTFPRELRDKHLYVCGGTGSGKSKFLEHLIRQDIVAWPQSRCGLLLLDPHGSLYDSLISWLAWHDPQMLVKRPIVPIDLRDKETVVSYNLLQHRPDANPSVVVDNFVEAMAYVWGQSGTDQTPLLARWASNAIRALYEKQYTLAEAVYLVDRQATQLRRSMTNGLSDPSSRNDWAFANSLSPKDFDIQVSSTLNRLQRFVRNEYMRAILGQAGPTLDLRAALDEGSIILVSLAKEKGNVSKENARLFGTLLLTDLWTAAQQRGKRKDVKPFYVYLDEFQRFVTPTISENLDEARGFGLHLTMAHQFPNQLINAGPDGKRLYDSIMENASTKVVFRLSSTENLKPLAEQLFLGTFDPDEIKLKLETTKVMGYSEEERETRTRGTSRGRAYGSSTTQGSAEGLSGSVEEPGLLGFAQSDQEASAWNSLFSDSRTEHSSDSEVETESVTVGSVLIPIMGKEISSVQYRSLDEQLFRAMAKVFGQQDRHCVVRVVGQKAPVFLFTPEVRPRPSNLERVQRFAQQQYQRWGFFLLMVDAKRRLSHREQMLLGTAFNVASDEVATPKRRIIFAPTGECQHPEKISPSSCD
jgi:hypothetical protein